MLPTAGTPLSRCRWRNGWAGISWRYAIVSGTLQVRAAYEFGEVGVRPAMVALTGAARMHRHESGGPGGEQRRGKNATESSGLEAFAKSTSRSASPQAAWKSPALRRVTNERFRAVGGVAVESAARMRATSLRNDEAGALRRVVRPGEIPGGRDGSMHVSKHIETAWSVSIPPSMGDWSNTAFERR